MIALDKITTEQNNEASAHIDEVSTLEMMRIMNEADSEVPCAVKQILPEIARAVDAIAERLRCGGRLIYMGAGSSGRLGVLDAAECPPTFSASKDLVQGIIAGGRDAMFVAQEGAEDSEALGRADLVTLRLRKEDIVCGIAASGRTPYVLGALDYAEEIGALTIALTCSEHSSMEERADITLAPISGPEVIAGSTRLKAGTAEKLVLNMLSTGTMIKLGKVYGNRMVDVKASNAKLKERALRIVREIAGVSREEAAALLKQSDGSAKLAILISCQGCSAAEGQAMLKAAGGRLADALKS